MDYFELSDVLPGGRHKVKSEMIENGERQETIGNMGTIVRIKQEKNEGLNARDIRPPGGRQSGYPALKEEVVGLALSAKHIGQELVPTGGIDARLLVSVENPQGAPFTGRKLVPLDAKLMRIRPPRMTIVPRRAVPDDLKDESYYHKRMKNTDSARRSRESKKILDARRVKVINELAEKLRQLQARKQHLKILHAVYRGVAMSFSHG